MRRSCGGCSTASVIRQLRRIIAAQRGMPSPSDTQLLQAFIDHRDESAVEMLIWRHGTMILNLCRRVLQDEHHAEDAFQATFLVLVRKARSIGKRQSVGSWLCKVAYRIAHRQRASLAKQPELLPEMNDLPEREPAHDLLRDAAQYWMRKSTACRKSIVQRSCSAICKGIAPKKQQSF